MWVLFGKGTLLENNLYESDAVCCVFNEDWSEFILCDWINRWAQKFPTAEIKSEKFVSFK